MDDDKVLRELWDERQVVKTVQRFGRCLDTGDWAAYDGIFTDRVNMDFQRMTGQPEVRIDLELMGRFGKHYLGQVKRHHTYTNFDIRVDADRAHAVVYFTARHWKISENGGSTYTQYGWYDFWLIRHAGNWKICRFKHDFVWADGNGGLFDLSEPDLVETLSAIFTQENIDAATDALLQR